MRPLNRRRNSLLSAKTEDPIHRVTLDQSSPCARTLGRVVQRGKCANAIESDQPPASLHHRFCCHLTRLYKAERQHMMTRRRRPRRLAVCGRHSRRSGHERNDRRETETARRNASRHSQPISRTLLPADAQLARARALPLRSKAVLGRSGPQSSTGPSKRSTTSERGLSSSASIRKTWRHFGAMRLMTRSLTSL